MWPRATILQEVAAATFEAASLTGLSSTPQKPRVFIRREIRDRIGRASIARCSGAIRERKRQLRRCSCDSLDESTKKIRLLLRGYHENVETIETAERGSLASLSFLFLAMFFSSRHARSPRRFDNAHACIRISRISTRTRRRCPSAPLA